MKMIFYPVLAFFIFFANVVFGQSKEERDNRAVYNRIEYFFNTGQADSIYHLASDGFKTQVGPGAIHQAVDYFGQFGRITDAVPTQYNQGIADYEVKIGERYARIRLAVDSNYRYTLLQIEEIQGALAPVKEEPVVSKVETVDELDHFVDSVARTYVQQLKAKSLAVGLITDNKVRTFFYGETEEGNQTPPTASSIYEIGSVTKTFTATLLAILVENGTLQLDDSIAKFLPDSVAGNPFIQKITFRSLANHTSGLPRLPDNLEAAPEFDPANPYATYGRAEMFAFLKSYKNEIEPGDQFEYSNLGYGLLGELISMVADQPYGQLVRDSIAVPLEMANTTQVLDPETQQLIAPHNSKGEEVAAWSFESMSGAGAFRSTVNDLLKYTLAQFVLPKNRLERAMMLTRQFSYFIPPNTDIGLAWHMNMVGDIIYYWHNGGTAGSSSFVALAPDKRTALVVLSNSSLSVDDISNSILQKVILAD